MRRIAIELCSRGYNHCLRQAFAALLKGDLAGRDRWCASAEVWCRWAIMLGAPPASEAVTPPRPHVGWRA